MLFTQDELPEFLRTLNTYAGSVLVKIAMQLLILTGVRPGELRQAEWQEFDFEKKVWNVPAERMKMRRPHLVPLSSQAIDLLNQLKPMTGAGALLFPGRNNPKKPMSDMALTVLVRRIGYAGRVTGHGFRHTMSTILHEQGLIRPGLSYSWLTSIRTQFVGRITMRSIWRRREMMQWYGDFTSNLGKEGIITS
jgi:integrase